LPHTAARKNSHQKDNIKKVKPVTAFISAITGFT